MEKKDIKFENYEPSTPRNDHPPSTPPTEAENFEREVDFEEEQQADTQMSVDLASSAGPAAISSASQLAQLLSSSPAPTTSNASNLTSMNMDSDVIMNSTPHNAVQKHPVNNNPDAAPFICASCGQKITERFLLKTMGKHWHEDCLKCACCSCRLGEVGSKLYFKQDMMLCKRDYLRLFGLTGLCAACHKSIPAFEMVMRARSNVYHLECFGCQECNHRFCVGDKFYLWDNKILCHYDYQERAYFAQMAYNYNNIAQLKQQFPEVDLDVDVQPTN